VNLVQFKKEVLEFLRQNLLKSFEKNNKTFDIDKLLKLSDELNSTNVENAIIPQFPLELLICKFTLSENSTPTIIELSKTETKEPLVKERKALESIKPSHPSVAKASPEEQTSTVTKIDKIEPEVPQEYKFTPEEFPEHKFTVKPTLEKIKEEWFDVLKDINSPTLKLAFKDTFLESFKDDLLTLSIRSEFHYNKMKTSEGKMMVEKALKEHFNVDIKVAISLSKIKVEEVIEEFSSGYEDYYEAPETASEPKPQTQSSQKKEIKEDSSNSIGPDEVYDLFNT
jgi:hypothetical protein